MDAKIEETVKQCKQCQDSQTLPPKAPLHPWQWPSHPWTRLHIDYCGPLCGKMCLVVVDSHSKWIEAYPVSTANSTITIEKLRYLFSQFGLPQSLVSDNAPYFVSEEFESFLKSNGIKHPTSSAYHPASNGLAERAVQTLKNGLKKVRDGTLKSRIARVLCQESIETLLSHCCSLDNWSFTCRNAHRQVATYSDGSPSSHTFC